MSAVSGSFQLFSCLLHIKNWSVQNGSNDQKAKDKLLHRSCYDNDLEISGGKSSTIQISNKRMKICALVPSVADKNVKRFIQRDSTKK